MVVANMVLPASTTILETELHLQLPVPLDHLVFLCVRYKYIILFFLSLFLNLIVEHMKGQAMCTFYNTYGTCKYGLGCKFDHPVMNYYNYTDPSIIFPNYQRNSPVICTPPDSTMSKSLKLTTDEGGDVTTKSKITITTTIATVDSNDANLLSEETSVAVTPQSSLQSSSSALENLLEANDQSSID